GLRPEVPGSRRRLPPRRLPVAPEAPAVVPGGPPSRPGRPRGRLSPPPPGNAETLRRHPGPGAGRAHRLGLLAPARFGRGGEIGRGTRPAGVEESGFRHVATLL